LEKSPLIFGCLVFGLEIAVFFVIVSPSQINNCRHEKLSRKKPIHIGVRQCDTLAWDWQSDIVAMNYIYPFKI